MVIWLVILAIMILIEAVTMGLTTVWFALGALGAAVVTGFGGGFWLQFTVFVILSFLSMIVFRPIAMRFFNPVKEKTNIDEIIGKKAVVIESIDNLQGTGKVRYTTVVNLLMLWAVRIPSAYLISRFFDGTYIMLCFPVSFSFGMFCMIGYYLFSPSWKALMKQASY